MKLTPEIIIDTICKEMEINVDDVLHNQTRKAEVVMCRHICFYLIRMHIKSKVYPEKQIELVNIAKLFKKNHATIIHALEKLDGYMRFNTKFRERMIQYDSMIERLSDDSVCVFCGASISPKSYIYN